MTESKDYSNMLRVGTLLHGTYRIDTYLASGGFGNTYEATNINFGERYAIKEFFLKGVAQRDDNNTTVSISNADNEASFIAQKEKFKSEAKLIRKLNNKHIVKLYDLFDENGTAYYVMEYIDGKSISKILKETGKPIDENTAINYVSQVLDALKEVHSHHFYHLDIKPSNIMVSNGRAILIDFGSSKQMKEEGGATTDTPLSYTPGYAPSELMDHDNAKFGPWTDLYSLGATLYNMVSLQKPPAISDILEDGKDAFKFPDNVSDDTRGLVLWMMSVGRGSRPQSIDEVASYIATHYNGSNEGGQAPDTDASVSVDDGATIVGDISLPDDEVETVVAGDGDANIGPSVEYVSTTSAKDGHGKKRVIIIAAVAVVIVCLGLWLLVGRGSSPSEKKVVSAVPDTTAAVVNEVHGKTFNDAKGNAFVYTGKVDKNGMPSGYGRGEYKYGIYKGNYKNGLKDGQGKFYESNGNTFSGTFVDDFYDEGEYYWKEVNRVYKGTFYKEGHFYNGTWYDKATGEETSKMVNGKQQEIK